MLFSTPPCSVFKIVVKCEHPEQPLKGLLLVWLIKCANKVANTGADLAPKLANTVEYLAPPHSIKFDQKC